MGLVVSVILAPTSPHRHFSDAITAVDLPPVIHTTWSRSYADTFSFLDDQTSVGLSKKLTGGLADPVTMSDAKAIGLSKKPTADSVNMSDSAATGYSLKIRGDSISMSDNATHT